MPSVNGVPYPSHVEDEKSLLDWIGSIDREIDQVNTPSALKISSNPGGNPGGHREVFRFAYFAKDDVASEKMARAMVCQQMAMELFSHLIAAPKAKLVWRVRPEFDVSLDTLPSDLTKVMTRSELERATGSTATRPVPLVELKKQIPDGDEWAIDFTTDTIFHAVAPTGEWRLFKSYMRYSVVHDDKVIAYPFVRAA